MQAMNGLDQLQPVPAMGPVGEYRLMPALDTFRVLPYAPHSGALLTDHVGPDGEPAPVCQRSFLKRMEARLAERGLTLRAAFENEFSLADARDGDTCPSTPGSASRRSPRPPRRTTPTHSSRAGGSAASRWSSTTRSSATASRRSRPAHAPALQAADEQLLVRETIRGVATQQGLVASLAPKPWPDNAGNGAHVHFSLWEGDRNRFYDGRRLSGLARAFIAGVLAHLPGLCGLTAPSFNSYHRIVPGHWAGAFGCWGFDNREAPVRVASPFRGVEEASTNAELKACDAAATRTWPWAG